VNANVELTMNPARNVAAPSTTPSTETAAVALSSNTIRSAGPAPGGGSRVAAEISSSSDDWTSDTPSVTDTSAPTNIDQRSASAARLKPTMCQSSRTASRSAT